MTTVSETELKELEKKVDVYLARNDERLKAIEDSIKELKDEVRDGIKELKDEIKATKGRFWTLWLPRWGFGAGTGALPLQHK